MQEQVGGSGIGRSVRRKEDDRYLRGRGEFIADIRLAGMKELAFVRSPLAHARLRAIRVPAAASGQVFTLADLDGTRPIIANSALPGAKPSEQPVLASGKVRHVGEAIAVCVAASRAEAEDIADSVELDLEELPPVVDMLAARRPDAPLLHEHWGDNVFVETVVEDDLTALRASAAVVVRRSFRTARQCMSPLEGRGVVAAWDRRLDQLVVHTATQLPHIVRTGLAECLGLDQGRIRVVAPDIGGGFGYKGLLLPEEVVAGWLARRLGHPVRWIEDRREQLTGNADCREHQYDGTVDPFSACLEAAQIASILPGPYVMRGYRCHTWAAATNKPPLLPYRGVARSGVCYVMEAMIDAVAHAVGQEPYEVRLRNLVPAEAMPYRNITNKIFDSGDYADCLRRAVAAIDVPAVRRRQAAGETVGVGFAIFCEQAAHGTSVYAGWGIPMVPGFEQAVARLTPDGGLELRVGIQSHGQGLETTLAQVAHEVLGIPLERIMVVHGDTALTPYSTGTWGSRCAVMAGGAVATACRELAHRIAAIGAHLLQVPLGEVQVRGGVVAAAGATVGIDEVSRTWYRRPQDLPEDVAPGGLEVASGYKPTRDTGTFSYAAHACVVEIDTELGDVRFLDYVIVEDGGVLLNPMIVDGQVIGGTAQGIGTALYEEMQFDAQGQPLASTLAEYSLPGATEVPAPRIFHMETPSPLSMFGQKGIGEGGAIGPPAAIANAVNDALRRFVVELSELPITPQRILAALHA
jgi:carbon-monoxide dehydrogenase large subunit